MKFGSVCSGIEAASVAFSPLGWKAVWFSEIEKFPAAVLAHHYPDVPNLGNMMEIHNDKRLTGTNVDVLCGGTPCQSFSIAGLRKGLEDSRGNLSLVFCQLAKQLSRENGCRWVLWENVPGVLSDKGNAFGCFLAELSGADAPLLLGTRDGKWKGAGVVLPANKDSYGLAWRVLDAQHFGVPQRRRRVFVVGYLGDWRPAAEVLFEPSGVCRDSAEGSEAREGVAANSERGSRETSIQKEVSVAPQFNAKAGTGGNLPICLHYTHDYNQDRIYSTEGISECCTTARRPNFMSENAIRRLTPTECERLQGFPDGYTAIPWRNKTKEDCPDGPRYKALGNSWAVPCAAWIGKRIAEVDAKIKETKK